MKDVFWDIALKQTARINKMEEKIAKEWYGCSYNELDEDERGEVTAEAYDRLG